jgi:energy-coupling factor transport system permease protein
MLKSPHPLAKLTVCLVWLAASILVFDARFQLAIIALSATLLVVLDRRSPLFVLALTAPFALFGFGFLTTSVLFRQDSDFALQMARETPFAGEAASAGLVLFLRAIASGMISAVFVLTTDPGKLLKALMRNWRLSPRIAHALFSAMQILPDLAGEAQQIRLARAMKRGRPPSRIPGPRETASLVIPLLAFAIRRASRAAIAMEAKGLGASRNRTILGAPEFGRRDIIFLLLSAALLTGLVLLV